MGKELAILPDKQVLLDVNKRIETMLPGGNKLQPNERYALAQIAVAHGLDPFNGEVWYIPGRGPMIGIKGLRKAARAQVQGNFWVEFVEVTDRDTRSRYVIPDGALAFEARLFDSENVRTYCDIVAQMTKSGIPWSDVKEIIGGKPYTSGIGVLKRDENTKMERAQCAMKRAEADALKRRFDVPFGIGVEADNEPDAVAGDWKIEGSQVIDNDDPKSAFERTCSEIGATDQEVSLVLEDAGGDYETAVQYLTKRVSARKLQNVRKQLGRDDSGF